MTRDACHGLVEVEVSRFPFRTPRILNLNSQLKLAPGA